MPTQDVPVSSVTASSTDWIMSSPASAFAVQGNAETVTQSAKTKEISFFMHSSDKGWTRVRISSL